MQEKSREQLSAMLLEIGSIRFGKFRLKLHEKQPDAPLSPIYVDLRLLRSSPHALRLSVAVYRELIDGLSFDCLSDVPTAATPIVGALAYDIGVPMVSPRLDAKSHGAANRIDGSYKPDDVALVVDDLITRADSKLDAISVLENGGLRVSDVVVLVDREQGGVDELMRRGYRCHSAFRLTELLAHYFQSGQISGADYDRTKEYLGKKG